jgi:SSS family solute:Na+ symporter
LFKRHNPDLSDHRLVGIGKVTTVVGTILAIVCSPVFGHYTTIFEGINKLISYVAPPITAVFLLGVFWKKASGRAAFITLIAGSLLGAAAFYVDWTGLYRGDFMLIAFLLLCACLVIMIACSLVWPEPVPESAKGLIWEDWREPLRGDPHGHGLANYRVATLAVLVVFVVLYLIFR